MNDPDSADTPEDKVTTTKALHYLELLQIKEETYRNVTIQEKTFG